MNPTLTITLDLHPAARNCPPSYSLLTDRERLLAISKYKGFETPEAWLAWLIAEIVPGQEDDLVFGPDGEIIGECSAILWDLDEPLGEEEE